MSYQIDEQDDGSVTITNPDGEIIHDGDNIRPEILSAILSDAGFDARQESAIKAAFGYPA